MVGVYNIGYLYRVVVYSVYMALVLFKPARLLLVVLLGTFSLAHFSYAALPCGNIVAPESFFDISHLSRLVTVPIDDCEDPFHVTSPTAPYVLKINGVEIPNGETAYVEPDQAPNIRVFGEPTLSDYQLYLFKHEADNYQFTETYSDYGEPLVLDVGTYTMVIKEYELILTQLSPWQRFTNLLIPVAYAQTVPIIYTITFDIAVWPPEPTGASSVLFLPGIMGSRLYEESDDCGSEIEEQERWFSTDTCDHLKLQTDFTGSSLNDLYTLPGEDGIVDETFGLNLYKTFLAELADWKEEDVIDDYAAIPYDWRLQLDKILKTTLVDGKVVYDVGSSYQDSYLYQKLEALVENSKSGKVTIVTHSNGGMVAKVLLQTMKLNNDPLLAKVDNLVLVGVPQSGTPEAVVGMLHGSALGPMGFALSQETSRKLMINMPFAHHLLPNEDYFDIVDTPVITFSLGTATDSWRETFGDAIQDQETLQNFLRKESGREVPTDADLATPAVVDGYLFDYTNVIQTLLQDWEPESDTKVYQIAGTGIETPSAIEYFTDQRCIERNPLLFFKCTRYEPKLGYRIKHVVDGDGTVVVPSAQGLGETENIENWWLDFASYNKDTAINRVHRDTFEVEELQVFITGVISSSTLDSYTYLATSSPEFSNEDRLLFRLHSPLDMYVVLHDGEIVGSSTPIVREVEYRRYGEVQQLSISEDEEDYEIHLVGLAFGSFTFDIDQYKGEELEERVTYSALPSSTSTKVMITLDDDQLLSEVSLLIDYEGDGVFETSALPGLGQVTFTVPGNTATSTTEVGQKGRSSGTKVKDRVLQDAPSGVLTAGVVEYETIEQELLLQFIEILTQYRDLLIKVRLQS